MIYIMRHGKTDWNAVHKLQGGTDIPLNEEGRAAAEEARQRFGDMRFDVCYCSPLIRARQTAEIFLRGTATPVVTDPRLREMSFGDYEGTENVFEKPDCPMYTLFKDPAHYRAQDGAESFEELFARTGEFIDRVLLPRHMAGERILVVGHGAMGGAIISRFRNLPLADFWSVLMKNCDLVRLDNA